MLKQIRHISEGNFYGLHVTNKAQKLNLEKELKTLEACQDAQTHGYRKEEKELVDILKRLNRNKDTNHEHAPEKSDRPSTRSSPRVAADDLSIHHDSAFMFNKPATGLSNVSIVIPLSPVASSTVSTHEIDERVALQMDSGAHTNMGSELHRTTGFTDCALCKLPRYERGRGMEVGRVCTCGPEHRRHIHVDKYQEEDGKKPQKTAKKHTKEELVTAVQEHDRRKSLETDHMIHDFLATLNPNKDHTTTNGHEKPHRQAENRIVAHNGHRESSGGGPLEGGDRRGSIGESYERFGSNPWSALEGNEGYIPRIGAQRRGSMLEYSVDIPASTRRNSIEEQDGYRSRRGSLEEYNRRGRRSSIDEQNGYRSRRGSLEEYIRRGRRSSIDEQNGHRSRRGSMEEYTRLQAPGSRRGSYRSWDADNDEEQNRRRGLSFEGRKNRRSSLDSCSFPPTYKSRTLSTAGDVYHVRAPPQLPDIPSPHQMPAFHGLLHPDNIINHHHFLPHEAEKQDQIRRASFDRSHDYYPHGDHPYSHVAAAFDRRHEQDCSNRTHHTISTLRRMLHTYQEKNDENTPNYPWPRPPVIEFTAEEFQKLKKCRYLRLPRRKSEEDLEPGETGNGAWNEN